MQIQPVNSLFSHFPYPLNLLTFLFSSFLIFHIILFDDLTNNSYLNSYWATLDLILTGFYLFNSRLPSIYLFFSFLPLLNISVLALFYPQFSMSSSSIAKFFVLIPLVFEGLLLVKNFPSYSSGILLFSLFAHHFFSFFIIFSFFARFSLLLKILPFFGSSQEDDNSNLPLLLSFLNDFGFCDRDTLFHVFWYY